MMQIDRNVSWGNIVSWILLIVGMAIGYGKLASATSQNTRDVQKALEMAEGVRASLIMSDAARNAQITTISVNVAETRTAVQYTEKKVDDILAEIRKTKK